MVMSRKRQLYVEGGGNQNPQLASECRRAFSMLFEQAGVVDKPATVVCGGRKNAYDKFCKALRENKADVWLLVDAEDCISSDPPFRPWEHVKERRGDGWGRPSGATDEQLQLMNVVMETWLLADHGALREVFPKGFDESELLAEGASLEKSDKAAIYASLSRATQATTAGEYGKGKHSFKVLAQVSPEKLRLLPWANRFCSGQVNTDTYLGGL